MILINSLNIVFIDCIMESNSNTQQTAGTSQDAPVVTFDDPVLSGLTPEQREAVEKLIKEKSTQLFE